MSQASPDCVPDPNIISVCESPAIILYGNGFDNVEINWLLLAFWNLISLLTFWGFLSVGGRRPPPPQKKKKKSWENCYATVQDYRRRFTDPYNIGVWEAD